MLKRQYTTERCRNWLLKFWVVAHKFLQRDNKFYFVFPVLVTGLSARFLTNPRVLFTVVAHVDKWKLLELLCIIWYQFLKSVLVEFRCKYPWILFDVFWFKVRKKVDTFYDYFLDCIDYFVLLSWIIYKL